MEARVLYKTDQWLSYGSRDLIGVFTNKEEYKKAVCNLWKIGATKLQIEMLQMKGQSQCSGEDFEFQSEIVTLNKVL